MLVNTGALGPVEVSPDHIFHLPEGLYGFEGKGDYALITKQDEDVTLRWFQSVDSTVPCFVVFDPFEMIDGYDPIVEPSDLNYLNSQDFSDLLFLVIAVVPEDIRGITVNLKSPIVINKRERLARQVILSNRDYPIQFPLFASEEEPQEPQLSSNL